ncbi:MAG: DUF3224 domain-containing protein [Armatimonadetes bacterium]|nr:DUF3224 domain-containing protein [Armatimonadota bacterium]
MTSDQPTTAQQQATARTALATIQITDWQEEIYDEEEGQSDGVRLSRATVKQRYNGAIEGESTVDHLMIYHADGSADFVGQERIVGSVDGRSGSLVLRHAGRYADGVANNRVEVVPGSGTGELKGLEGWLQYAAGHGRTMEIEFNYKIA